MPCLRDAVGALEADLAATQADLAGVEADLAGVQADLAGVQADLAGVQADLAGVQADLEGALGTIAALADLLLYVSVDPLTNSVLFTGANVFVRSGSGATDGEVNGLGNIIMGYGEDATYFDAFEAPSVRTGSHNLVVGGGSSFSSFGGFVAGRLNRLSGEFSSVSGGQLNQAVGEFSSVSGGGANLATGWTSSVSGGQSNEAFGDFTSVLGGITEIALSALETIPPVDVQEPP